MADQPQIPSKDDVMEDLIMQQEDMLDEVVKRHKAQGLSSEGPRFQVVLRNPKTGEDIKVTNTTDEEKAAVAQAAVARRVDNYNDEAFKIARFKLSKANEVEAVDLIAEQNPGDKDIYLQAEKAGKNRKAVFEVFGEPAGDEYLKEKK